MKHLVTEEFSKEQLFIVQLRLNNIFYEEIILEFNN